MSPRGSSAASCPRRGRCGSGALARVWIPGARAPAALGVRGRGRVAARRLPTRETRDGRMPRSPRHPTLRLWLLVGLLGIAVSPLFAANGLNRIGYGARSTGLGGAFTALADDTTAINTNPAGLAQLQGQTLEASLALSQPRAPWGCHRRHLLGGA